ncbi:MAG: thioredoxin [Alphaproteobacteria bacterium]|nr:thioredoxin [Alphaproteobacteria bacterium]
MALIHINDSDFDSNVAGGITLIDFWAEWCGPCRMFGPIFETAAAKHPHIKFAKFEIDDANRRVPAKYGVRSIPAVLAFRDGEVVSTRTGLLSEQELESWINEFADGA